MSPRRPVLHDVARLAGVSHQTVSRVVNNHPHVKAATRERVLHAMRELDYRPNVLARSLVTRRTHRIGVISVDSRMFGPGSTLAAIERAAYDRGYAVVIASMSGADAAGAETAVGLLDAQRVDGLIVIAPHDGASRALARLPRAVPVVAVEAEYRPEVPVVAVDQVLGATLATRHLLELGHREVWHVAGPKAWREATLREQGWRDSLRAAGAEIPEVLRGDWTARSGYELGRELAARPDVTAVFAANDQMALGVLHALHERGRDVPGSCSVVGFDDIPEAEFFEPGLTTVRQDFDAIGRIGLERLVGAIEDDTRTRRRTLIEPRLVVRASTAVHGRRGRPSATR